MSYNSIDYFCNHAKNTGVFEPDEEIQAFQLLERNSNNSELISFIFEHNIGLIKKNTQIYYNHPYLDEIQQEAAIGLLIAIERFDYKKGYKFSTYATYWIRKYIVSFINNGCRTIRLPYQLESNLRKLEKFMSFYQMEHEGHSPSFQEMKNEMDMNDKQLKNVLKYLPQKIFSLDQPKNFHSVGQDGEDAFVANFLSTKNDLADAVTDKVLMDQITHSFPTTLTEQEYDIIIKKYVYNMSYREMGKLYGMTHENVRRIHNKAIGKLKKLEFVKT